MSVRAFASLFISAAVLTIPATLGASSHREAPAIAYDPAADNTDLYVWTTPGSHDRVHIVANWIPFAEPAGGPNFHQLSDDVRYEIHVARGATSLEDVVAWYVRCKRAEVQRVDPANQGAPLGGGKEFFIQLTGLIDQKCTVTKVQGGQSTVLATDVPVAPPNIGPRTQEIAFAGKPYDDAFAATYVTALGSGGAEGRIFIGPRDDGFYADLGGIFDLANLRAKGTAQDGLAGFNVQTIALEIPTTLLTENGQAPGTTAGAGSTIAVWAASSRPKVSLRRFNGRTVAYGPWVQVSRLGLPLVNEVVIGLQDKDKYNATHPRDDATNFGAYFQNPVVVRDAEAVGIYGALGVDPNAMGLKFNRTDIIDLINLNGDPATNRGIQSVGDVLRVDLATDSRFPNGRQIPGGATNGEQVDVTDALLNVVLARGTMPEIGDGVDRNDKAFLSEIPWLPAPWQGFAEGHGRPTP